VGDRDFTSNYSLQTCCGTEPATGPMPMRVGHLFRVNLPDKQTLWPESASELYRPSDRRLSAKLKPTFTVRGCHVVGVTDPYDRNLGFQDRSSYFFFQVAPQLHSRGRVDPVSDPLLLRKSGSAGNRTRTS
jgi:hypothetical protein